jgi:hypothetical protein
MYTSEALASTSIIDSKTYMAMVNSITWQPLEHTAANTYKAFAVIIYCDTEIMDVNDSL